jgi:hypothetical protein
LEIDWLNFHVMESSEPPLPQRQRKRRARETHDCSDETAAVAPVCTAVQEENCESKVGTMIKAVPRERIDACEYFGVPSLAVDTIETGDCPKVFHDFPPNVTNVQFECECVKPFVSLNC